MDRWIDDRSEGWKCIFFLRWWIIWSLSEMWQLSRGRRKKNRLKCSDLHIHVRRDPFDIFFSLPGRRRCRRGCRSVWSYESCKISNLMHRRLQRGKVSARKLRTCIDDPGRFSFSFANARLCLAFFRWYDLRSYMYIALCILFRVRNFS